MRTIVWFRGKDLRISDHAPLRDAAKRGEVIPLFVLDPYFFDPERALELPHRMQFLLDALVELEANIAKLGSQLLVVPGRSAEVVPRLFREWKADEVVAHRWTEPFGRERDRRIQETMGGQFRLYEGETLLSPTSVRTQSGRPYSVFTRFAATFLETAEIHKPVAAPSALPPLPKDVRVQTVPIPEFF